MPNRAQDRLRQAKRDLQQTQASQANERHEWACFAAHQAAEKAVKALHLFFGQAAWVYLVARLFTELPPDQTPDIPALLFEKAKVLDNFYIPNSRDFTRR